jgi:capsid protein
MLKANYSNSRLALLEFRRRVEAWQHSVMVYQLCRAEIEQIDAGLKSRTQAIAERGYDAEQVDAEIAADKAREAALGLGFDGGQITMENADEDAGVVTQTDP